MQLDPIIEPLLNSSKLPVYLAELTAFYDEEKKKRDEFHEWLTPDVKAEFIQGEVVIHSPARNKHLDVTKWLLNLLSTYVDLHDLGTVKAEKALIKLTRNSFEPDICFFEREKAASFTDDTLLFPVPDFVVEVLSSSTEKTDRTVKMEDYALHGVREYWLVDTDKEIIEQYFLSKGVFVLQPHHSGPFSSLVITGLRVMAGALFNREENLIALRSILTEGKKTH
jgi:Uma2 family endonuclease